MKKKCTNPKCRRSFCTDHTQVCPYCGKVYPRIRLSERVSAVSRDDLKSKAFIKKNRWLVLIPGWYLKQQASRGNDARIKTIKFFRMSTLMGIKDAKNAVDSGADVLLTRVATRKKGFSYVAAFKNNHRVVEGTSYQWLVEYMPFTIVKETTE